MIHITEAIALDDREVEERFVRATGPGGQNARKEATAVEWRLDIGRSSLPADVKTRLRSLAGRRVTTRGVLVIVSRAFRSQADNREAARARFVALLQRAAAPPALRRPTRPRRAVRERRQASKRLRSAVKQSRASGRRRGV
jgi:ribosome-associated protein